MNVHMVICAYDPPFNDGRVVRIKTLSKFLNKNGYNVNIYSFGSENKIIKQETETLYQVKFPGMGNISNEKVKKNKFFIISLVVSRLVFPDRYIVKLITLHNVIKKNIKEKDILIISGPWFSSFLILLSNFYSKQKLLIILDYRDLWSNNPIFTNKLTSIIARYLEKIILKRVDLVLVTTESAKKLFNETYSNEVLVIKNGVSTDDISLISNIKKNIDVHSFDKDCPYVVSYFGTLGNKRRCDNFLKTLYDANTEIRLYGNIDFLHRNCVENSFKGNLNKIDMFEACLKSTFILIVIMEAEHDLYAIPGKIYETLAINVPIILYSRSESFVYKYLMKIEYPMAFFEIGILYSKEEVTQILNNALKLKNKNNLHELVIREQEFSKLIPFFENHL